jgi:hypothetical protein
MSSHLSPIFSRCYLPRLMESPSDSCASNSRPSMPSCSTLSREIPTCMALTPGTGGVAENEDDLDALVRRVDTLPVGTEICCVSSIKARLLGRISVQNAEHGVVRNYVRNSTFLSHPSFLSDTTLCCFCRLNGSPHCHGFHHPLHAPSYRSPTSQCSYSLTRLLLTRSLLCRFVPAT